MVLSARYVKHPQSDRLLFCTHCDWPISGAHIRLYGMADENEKPYTLRYHVNCMAKDIDISQEPKIETASKKAKLDA